MKGWPPTALFAVGGGECPNTLWRSGGAFAGEIICVDTVQEEKALGGSIRCAGAPTVRLIIESMANERVPC